MLTVDQWVTIAISLLVAAIPAAASIRAAMISTNEARAAREATQKMERLRLQSEESRWLASDHVQGLVKTRTQLRDMLARLYWDATNMPADPNYQVQHRRSYVELEREARKVLELAFLNPELKKQVFEAIGAMNVFSNAVVEKLRSGGVPASRIITDLADESEVMESKYQSGIEALTSSLQLSELTAPYKQNL